MSIYHERLTKLKNKKYIIGASKKSTRYTDVLFLIYFFRSNIIEIFIDVLKRDHSSLTEMLKEQLLLARYKTKEEI